MWSDECLGPKTRALDGVHISTASFECFNDCLPPGMVMQPVPKLLRTILSFNYYSLKCTDLYNKDQADIGYPYLLKMSAI